MRSFGLLRTNVGLTTNLKIMVRSNYKLSLDGIESNEELSLDKYKDVSFNKNNYYDELIPYFYKELPKNLAFDIKYDDDVDDMGDDFVDQYDELYQYGARNVINNKSYEEEYEYFAPLYLGNILPKKFIIFRVDGPGLGVLTKDTFRAEILRNLKTVKLFDLTNESNLGQWLNMNFVDNEFFPLSPIDMDFRNLEFSKWNGIDYKSGGYVSKSRFMDDILENEKEIFELERFIFNSFRDNGVVFPNILNLSFLFDDNPSTPDLERKWSLNRYLGFYLDDMELKKTISPYITPILKSGVIIENGNILTHIDGNPFVEEWSSDRPFYVEYDGNYYKVETFEEEVQNVLQQNSQPGSQFVIEGYQNLIIKRWRIISDKNLSGKENDLNNNIGIIDSDNKLVDYLGNSLIIDDFDSADTWLIEIDGVYHNLLKDNGDIKLMTDYSFEFGENDFTYKVSGVSKSVSIIVDRNNQPKKFNIYRLKYSDIKDFDDRIVDTEYSKYEYEKEEELTMTDETKMYFENLLSNSNPKDLDDFVYKNEVVNIPVSSEYTANYETFKIEDNDLSEIWRKNPVYCRWVYQNSLSANDYPYLLNNSNIFEDYNRTVNTDDPDPKRIERNLDHFYTINSSTSSYTHHSLHIEKLDIDGNIDNSFRFELDKYLNTHTYSVGTTSTTYTFDYFSSFFDRNALFNNSKVKKNVKKYSSFNRGDKSIPNFSLFRGIEFSIYDVESITLNDSNDIDVINLETSNKFEDYKLSILLSDNDHYVDDEGVVINSVNNMSWSIIDNWRMDKEYNTGDIVIFDDILYQALAPVNTTDPTITINGKQVKSAPYNITEWSLFNTGVFWYPSTSNDYVYNNGDYYYDSGESDNFWYPQSGYSQGDIVLYKGGYYMSMTSSNYHDPNNIDNGYWVATQSISPKWKLVELWNPSLTYATQSKYIIHNDILWEKDINVDIDPGEEPGVSLSWDRIYSLVPDTDFVYKPTSNKIINMNNVYYLMNSNNGDHTLENGIVIYINKKFKNILININISDNTLPNISEKDRDDLYSELYSKLTSNNLINSINNIDDKSGFSDYLTYVIIDEDGNISNYRYDNNIVKLPYIIKCNTPDMFSTKVDSLIKKPISLSNEIQVSKRLSDGNLINISDINFFNGVPISVEIKENEDDVKIFDNYHGNKNIIKKSVFRYGGFYMPLFYDIQLFNKDTEFSDVGNYRFDTSLSEFGIIKERKISKINRKGSILKLNDKKDIKSIYPMIDEFGYSVKDFFIFSSTWDYRYHVEMLSLGDNSSMDIPTPTTIPPNIGQPIFVGLKKLKF